MCISNKCNIDNTFPTQVWLVFWLLTQNITNKYAPNVSVNCSVHTCLVNVVFFCYGLVHVLHTIPDVFPRRGQGRKIVEQACKSMTSLLILFIPVSAAYRNDNWRYGDDSALPLLSYCSDHICHSVWKLHSVLVSHLLIRQGEERTTLSRKNAPRANSDFLRTVRTTRSVSVDCLEFLISWATSTLATSERFLILFIQYAYGWWDSDGTKKWHNLTKLRTLWHRGTRTRLTVLESCVVAKVHLW